MPEQNRENLVRRDECAVAVHRSDAVRVTVESETGVILAPEHCLPKRLHVRLDGLRVHAAEERVAIATDFIRADSVTAQKLEQQPAARPVHRIDHKAKLGRANAVPID